MNEADRAIAALSERQHGAFSRAQALERGHSPDMIRHRLKIGRWESIYPTVYSFAGSPETWRKRQSAACLWTKGAASGCAAGHLHGLPGCQEPPIEVVTTNHVVTPHSGVIVHRTKRLPAEQIIRIDGIPSTTIERTLLDICGLMSKRRAAIALDNALLRGLTTLGAIDHCLFLTARRGRNGCGVLRDLMKARLGLNTAPNSPLETVIHELLLESSLPTPELQHVIRDDKGAFVARPDFVYPTEKLIIEGHSKLWHWGQRAESEDLEKHNALSMLGYSILYVTWQDATTYRERTAATIARLLRVAA